MDTYTQADLDRAVKIAKEHAGGLYIWGGCSRRGSDCSGFQSIVINALNEWNLYTRRFGTGNWKERYRALGFVDGLGDDNDYSLGILYPWESSSGIGHVAGTLGTLAVESRGSRGVLVGPTARNAKSELFRHRFHLPIKDSPKPPAPTSPPYPGILRVGMHGQGVRTYQARMHRHGWQLDVDGIFGRRTREVTLAFQKAKRLAIDGIVGPKTWAAAFK
jgi:peptidoglycan hydrolase-like protein with peptidoglycan-binding domain